MLRLAELDPRWLVRDGVRIGIVFFCPCCHGKSAQPFFRLSCFFVRLPIDGESGQEAAFRTVLTEDEALHTMPCKPGIAWAPDPKIEQATFDNLSVTPSLDASAARHWHGFITKGEIK